LIIQTDRRTGFQIGLVKESLVTHPAIKPEISRHLSDHRPEGVTLLFSLIRRSPRDAALYCSAPADKDYDKQIKYQDRYGIYSLRKEKQTPKTLHPAGPQEEHSNRVIDQVRMLV